ncbi:MAG TPA: class I SAM-dependent methyltransferase [Verrucomicrobiae bacterium]|nr:class I SAM-dependent methyltransferase [Verrucomicrobiae bacterium]
MELSAALRLIRHEQLLAYPSASWADLGCGTGFFTSALAQLLPEGSTVYAVDKSRAALAQVSPPPKGIRIETMIADFTAEDLSLPLLDGILMANSLHYVPEQPAFLARAQKWLKAEGCFLVVEYDTHRANPWVPYPVPYSSLAHLFYPLSYKNIQKLGEHPSHYQPAPIYSALVRR